MEIGAETQVVRIEPIVDPVPRERHGGDRSSEPGRPEIERVAGDVEPSAAASSEREGALR